MRIHWNLYLEALNYLALLIFHHVFSKSIVIYKLLKRNGQNPILHIGVKNIGDLEAHAWIEFEGKMLDDDLGYRVFTSIK